MAQKKHKPEEIVAKLRQVDVLLSQGRPVAEAIRTIGVTAFDNGPEHAGRLLDQWAYLNGVEIEFSRPGKPTDNAYIEAFNARLGSTAAAQFRGRGAWSGPCRFPRERECAIPHRGVGEAPRGYVAAPPARCPGAVRIDWDA